MPADDDVLMEHVAPMLDSMYAFYAEAGKKSSGPKLSPAPGKIRSSKMTSMEITPMDDAEPIGRVTRCGSWLFTR